MDFNYKSFVKNIFKVFLIGCLLAVMGYLIFLSFERLDAERKIERGIVQDKWIATSETEEGSYFVPKLLLETENLGKSTVRVERKLYDRVKIGMTIERNDKGEFEIVKE